MTNEAWGNGWLQLRAAFPQQVAEEVAKVRGKLYREKLDDLSDAEWMAAVDRAVNEGDFFPTVKTLRKYGRPEHLAASGAAVAYAEILDRFERGEHPLLREIRENLGRAAAEAFMAAGGEFAFLSADTRNAVFRFDKFVKAYEAVVADDSKAALPQESIAEALGLPVGEALPLEKVVPSTLGMKRIEGPTPPPRLVPKPTTIVPSPKEETTSEMLARVREMEKNAKPIVSTDERLAELKAQADIIKGAPGPKGFALIEGIIVIAILGVILAIGWSACPPRREGVVSQPEAAVPAWLRVEREAALSYVSVRALCDTRTGSLLYLASMGQGVAITVVKDGCQK